MKKAIIIFGIGSLVLFGCSYFFMQKSAALIKANDQMVEEIENPSSTELANRIVIPDQEDKYFYNDMRLNQADHISINNCLQYYTNDKSFENANRCEEQIVDVIVKNIGVNNFIKALIGNTISYNKDVSLKSDFPRTLFSTPTYNTSLKSKLILTFLNRYRDPLKLKEEFDNYKVYFYETISKSLYSKLFEDYLNTYIESYDEIQEQADIEAFYKNIYYEAETKNKHAEFWNITFWKRRELEKNDQVIYSILNEIKTHYENDY